jgi:hypothetical protein
VNKIDEERKKQETNEAMRISTSRKTKEKHQATSIVEYAIET